MKISAQDVRSIRTGIFYVVSIVLFKIGTLIAAVVQALPGGHITTDRFGHDAPSNTFLEVYYCLIAVLVLVSAIAFGINAVYRTFTSCE